MLCTPLVENVLAGIVNDFSSNTVSLNDNDTGVVAKALLNVGAVPPKWNSLSYAASATWVPKLVALYNLIFLQLPLWYAVPS